MLAERLGGILPPMTDEEALESAAIQSLGSNGFDVRKWRHRPFRAPHHRNLRLRREPEAFEMVEPARGIRLPPLAAEATPNPPLQRTRHKAARR